MAGSTGSGSGSVERSLVSIFRQNGAAWAAIIEEQGGKRWEAETLAELERRLAHADSTQRVRCESRASRVAYVTTACRNTARVVIARETGLFARAVGGDVKAAQDLLMVFWTEIERAVHRARAEEYDSIVFARVVEGFASAVTSRRTPFRAKDPDALPRLVRVICERVITKVLAEHGLRGKEAVHVFPFDDRRLEDSGEAATEEDRRLLESLICIAVAAPATETDEGGSESFSAMAAAGCLMEFLAKVTPTGARTLQDTLLSALDAMPENHRRAVLARAYHSAWSVEELVEALGGGVKPTVFRTWLKRGRDYLAVRVREFLCSVTVEEMSDREEARRLRRLQQALAIEVEPAV